MINTFSKKIWVLPEICSKLFDKKFFGKLRLILDDFWLLSGPKINRFHRLDFFIFFDSFSDYTFELASLIFWREALCDQRLSLLWCELAFGVAEDRSIQWWRFIRISENWSKTLKLDEFVTFWKRLGFCVLHVLENFWFLIFNRKERETWLCLLSWRVVNGIESYTWLYL